MKSIRKFLLLNLVALLVLIISANEALANIWAGFSSHSFPLSVAIWMVLITFMGFLAVRRKSNSN